MPRNTLIGRDLGPYNRASATGEYGKGVYAREVRREGSAMRSVGLRAVSAVHTVGRSVR